MYIRILFLAILVFTFDLLNAQYSTPGDNLSLTLENLVEQSSGAVTIENNNYHFNQDVTISSTDTLWINNADSIKFEPNILFLIEGEMNCSPAEPAVFCAIDSVNGFKGITFDECNQSVVENAEFLFSGGLKLLYSDITIRNCSFYKSTGENGSGAVNMLGSNPLIENCEFLYSFQSAISSGATSNSSPIIRNNYIFHNNTENGNRPQINLGTSDGTNDIIIEGNTIDGAYDEAGGVSLATLAGGSITAIVQNNIITNNRYGLNVYGTVDADISYNHIIDNNLEDNPMYGGSGISFYYGATALVYENIISGNLWGVTILSDAVPNLGQIVEDTVNIGHNYIFENGNNGITYNLYNNTAGDIYSQNNYWGVDTPEEAAIGIVDNADDNSLGTVFYEPVYTLSNDNEFYNFGIINDDVIFYGEINDENQSVEIVVPANLELDALMPVFEVFDYADVYIGDEVQISGESVVNFIDPQYYLVVAEDGTVKEYEVSVVNDTTGIDDQVTWNVKTWPVPARDFIQVEACRTVSKAFLYNENGKLCAEWQPNRTSFELPLERFHSGVYFLKILSPGVEPKSIKIIK